MKMNPLNVVNSSEGITHISDTTERQSQDGLLPSGPPLDHVVSQADAVDDEAMRQTESLMSKVILLHIHCRYLLIDIRGH